MADQYDVTNVLLDLGVDRASAEMAVPFMFMMPATTDPYSPNVIMIVNGIQKRLREKGFSNKGHGFVDKGTASALDQLAGRNWRAKTWLQIAGDVLHKVGPTPDRGSAMGYAAMGSLARADWCSKSNPQGNCKPLVGVVKPMTLEAAATFKDLQTQANRCANKMGLSAVGVDGRIGPGTLSLANKIVSTLKKQGTSAAYRALANAMVSRGISQVWPLPSVEYMATIADDAAFAFRAVATATNAPLQPVSPPPSAPPSGSGGVVNPPNDQIVAGMPLMLRIQQSSLFYPGVAALVIGSLYYFGKSKGKGKKKGLLAGIF